MMKIHCLKGGRGGGGGKGLEVILFSLRNVLCKIRENVSMNQPKNQPNNNAQWNINFCFDFDSLITQWMNSLYVGY